MESINNYQDDDYTYTNLNHSDSTDNSFIIINFDLLYKILLIISIFFSVCIILVIICHIFENPYSNICCLCNRFKRKKGIEIELGIMNHNLVKDENKENNNLN